MDHRIAGKLLERYNRVIGLANLRWPGGHINRRLDVGFHLLIQAADDLTERSINVLRVLDRVGQSRSINSQELDVGARDEIAGQFAQNQATGDRGDWLVNPLDHAGRGQTLLIGTVVLFQDIGSHGPGQVLLLKKPSIQIVQFGVLHRVEVERQIMMAALLVQNSLVLGGGNRTTRAGSYPDPSFVLNWWSVGRLDENHREFATGKFFPFDGHAGYGQNVSVRFHVRQCKKQLIGDGQAGTCSVVLGADKNDTRFSVVWEVIGESTNSLTDGVRSLATKRFFPLDHIGFKVF